MHDVGLGGLVGWLMLDGFVGRRVVVKQPQDTVKDVVEATHVYVRERGNLMCR